MSAPETVSDPELQEVAWDLSDLLNGAAGGNPQAGVDALLADAQTRADAFADSYAGKLAEIDGAGLVTAMRELAEIEEIAARAGTYAHLAFSTDTQSPANGALLQRVEEKGTAIETKLLFFHLEWAALDDAKADELLATDGLDFARHHLATARRYRPHLLSEPEERILAEKQLSGRSAWTRLFEEQTAAITVDLDGAEVPLDAALSNLFNPDRAVRKDVAERVTAALQPGLRTRAYAFNTLLADKMVDDRLRAYPHWLAARNLSNEASDESVQALIEAVRARSEVPRRWYRLKAQLLGIDKLADYDRMAAVTQDNEKINWPEAKEIVRDAYSTFSGELGGIIDQFFDNAWIDGPGAAGQARRRVLLLRRAFAAPVRAPELHAPAPGRADARARARARRARGAGRVAGRLPHGDAADAGRDRLGVRRDAGVRAPAGGLPVAGVQALAAGRVDRGLDRDRLPPGGDEPLRAPHPHAAA